MADAPAHEAAHGAAHGAADQDALRSDARALGVDLDADQAGRLATLAGLLEHWNRSFNLVSRQDVGRLHARHLLDSLSAVPWLTGTSIMDLGTGAGLPGLPLAIAQPQRSFTLVDRSRRKIRFIGHACRSLGLDNVTPVAGDVRSSLPADSRFDTIVARAVADMAEVWALGRARLQPGGRLVVWWRGQSGEARPEHPPDDLPGLARVTIHEIVIPGLRRPHRLAVLETEGGGA